MKPSFLKPLVYIASPYTLGDVAINVKTQIDVFSTLMKTGIITPFAPLMSHFIHMINPQPYQNWMMYDLEILAKCDALLRIDSQCPEMNYSQSESSGATLEVAFMTLDLNRPVFFSVDETVAWAKNFVEINNKSLLVTENNNS